MRSYIPFLFTLFVTLSAQNARIGESRAKTMLAVPMVGTGTWADPKRPAFVRESGVPFRFQVSDDGTMALVEASPRNLAEAAKLDAFVKNDPRSKIFRPEKDRKADVEAEFKRLKKDFDPESFGRLAPGKGK